MRRFTVFVIALILAPGLISAVPKPEIELTNYPLFIGAEVEAEAEAEAIPRPFPVVPEFLPETQPEFEDEPVWENEVVVPPKLISLNPCEACFEYMTALIDQLTEVAVPEYEIPVHPELPEIEFLPEVPEVGRPLPLPVEPEHDLRPLPLPVAPETEVRPLPAPVPTEAEAEEALASQGIPLPTHIIRK